MHLKVCTSSFLYNAIFEVILYFIKISERYLKFYFHRETLMFEMHGKLLDSMFKVFRYSARY